MTTATLALNLNTTQAEAMLKALKVGFEGLGKTVDNATQKANTFAVTLQKGVNGIKLAKLQGNMVGLTADIRLAAATAKQLSTNFAELFVAGRQVGVMYEGMAGQQYKTLVNSEALIIAQQKLVAGSTAHANVIAETINLQSGQTASIQKYNAELTANLAVAKLKHGASVQDLKDITLQTLATHQLTAAQKAAVMKDLGFGNKTKETAAVKALTEAERVELSVKEQLIVAQRQLDSLKAKTVVLTNQEAMAIAEKTAIERGNLAVTQALMAAEAKRLEAITRNTIMQTSSNAAMAQAALINAGLGPKVEKTASSIQKVGNNAKVAATKTKTFTSALRGAAIASNATSLAFGSIIPMLTAFLAVVSTFKTVKLGSEFEYLTTYITTLVNETQKVPVVLEEVQEKLRSFKGLAHGPIELAEGVKLLVKAGFPAAQALEEIGKMSQFATVAELELGSATEFVRSQYSAWEKQVGSLSQVANMLTMATSSTALSFTDLQQALKQTTELATVSGVSFNELLAGLGKLADAGIKGSQAGSSVRTAIIRIQSPASAVAKQLEKLKLSMDIFTPSHEFKGLIQMFKEVARVSKEMTDEQRTDFFFDLFGLRQMKGGAKMVQELSKAAKEGTLSMEELATNIQKAGEEGTFLETIFNKLAKTTKVKFEMMKASLQDAFIGAFDSKQVGSMLDDLIVTIESPAFKEGLITISKGILSVVQAITTLISTVAKLNVTGLSFGDMGLIGYIIFGTTPPARIIASLVLVEDQINKFNKTRIEPPKLGDPDYWEKFWKGMKIPNIGTIWKDATELSDSLIVVFNDMYDLFNIATAKRAHLDWWNAITGKDMKASPIMRKVDIAENILGANDLAKLISNFEEVAANSKKMSDGIYTNLKSVITGFKDYDKVLKQFNKDSADMWDAVERASNKSVKSQLKDMWLLENASTSVGNRKQITPKYGNRKKSGLLVDGQEVESAFLKYRTVAGKFYYELGNMAKSQKAEERAALDAYVDHYKKQASDMVKLTGPIGESLRTLSVNPDILKGLSPENIASMGADMKEAAGVSKLAFDEFFKSVQIGIDNIIKKEQQLLSEIKKYSSDIGDAHKSAGDARFSLLQKYSTEAQKYMNTIKRINELNSKAREYGKISKGMTGEARAEMYGKAQEAAKEALSLSSQLNEVEGSNITAKKARGDAAKAINEYEKISVQLAKEAKAAAVQELQELEKKKVELQSVSEAVAAISTTLGKVHTLKLDSEGAMTQLAAFQEELSANFAKLEIKDIIPEGLGEAFSQELRKVNGVFTNKDSAIAIKTATDEATVLWTGAMTKIDGVWVDSWDIVNGKMVASSKQAANDISKILDAAVEKERTAIIKIVTQSSNSNSTYPTQQTNNFVPQANSNITTNSAPVVNVNFTLPGASSSVPAVMTQNDANILMAQLAKANRLSS